MNVQATIDLAINGVTKRVVTDVSLDEIDAVGVRWCTAFASLQNSDLPEYLATLCNIAAVCHQHERYVHELAALRLAQRLTRFTLNDINVLVDNLRGNVQFESNDLPKNVRILSFADEPAEFAAALAGHSGIEDAFSPAAPFGGVLGAARLPAQDNRFHNTSFHIFSGSRRLATVPCLVLGKAGLTWTVLGEAFPIKIYFAEDCDQHRSVIAYVLEYLNYLMKVYAASCFVIEETSKSELPIYRMLGTQNVMTAEIYDIPVVDLGKSEQAIFDDVRKSYRSHINWGRANLRTEYVGGSIAAQERQRLWDILYDLHQKSKSIARRGNLLSRKMFDLIMDQVERGEGEVAIARTNDDVVCGMTVTLDGPQAAYYALGGSLAIGNKNPQCFNLYDAILRAKSRGRRTYLLNISSPAKLSVDGLKLRLREDWINSINVFKRGFSSTFEISYVYTVFPEGVGRVGSDALWSTLERDSVIRS
ncbi:MAG: hypothetical protein ABSE64_16765 [Vulcanimicrobiaceae bacterium]